MDRRRVVSVLLALVAVGACVSVGAAEAETTWARAQVRVFSGLYERESFRATLSLDAEKLARSLPTRSLPAKLEVTVVDTSDNSVVPATVTLNPGTTDAKLPRPPSVDVSFLVRGPLEVMEHRDFVVELGHVSVGTPPLDARPPFLSLEQTEVRLMSLNVQGAGDVYQFSAAPSGENLLVNGDFEQGSWLVDSVGPGWTSRSFHNFPNFRAEAVPAVAGSTTAGTAARLRENDGIYAGIVSTPFEVTPGARYRMRLRLRGGTEKKPADRPFNCAVTFKFHGPKGADDLGDRAEINWPDLTLRGDWLAHEKIFAVPPGAKWGFVIIKARFDGEFGIDDVQLQKLEQLPAVVQLHSTSALLPRRLDPEEGSSENVIWDAQQKRVTLRTSENLIANGSFESEGGWTFTGPHIARDAEQKTHGGSSLAIKIQPSADKAISVATSTPFTIDPAKCYVLSIDYRAHNQVPPVRVRVEAEDRTILLDDVLPTAFAARQGNGWIRRSVKIPAGLFTERAVAQKATLALIRPPSFSGDPASIDSVCLVESTVAAPFAEKETHPGEGQLISEIIDLGLPQEPRLRWEAETPEGTTIDVFVRTGFTPFYRQQSWDSWRRISSGQPLPIMARGLNLYAQFKVILRTDRAGAAPQLAAVELQRGPQSVPHLISPPVQVVAIDNGQITDSARRYLQTLAIEEPIEALEKKPGFMEMRRIGQQVATPYQDEFDQQRALLDYVCNNMVACYALPWKYTRTHELFDDYPYFKWFENGTRGEGGICSHFGISYAALCRAIGMPSRMMTLGSNSGAGHNMSEIWSDKFQKWYYADSQYGSYLTLEGIPQSLLDMQRLLLSDQYYRLRTHTGAQNRTPEWSFERGWGEMSDSRYVGRVNKSVHPEMIGTHFLGWNETRPDLFHYFRTPGFLFMDDPWYNGKVKEAYTAGMLPAGEEDLEFKLNQVEFVLEPVGPTELAVHLQHNAVDFDHYELRTNGEGIVDHRDTKFAWKLRAGPNHLFARTVSRAGHKGKEFHVDVLLQTAPNNSN